MSLVKKFFASLEEHFGEIRFAAASLSFSTLLAIIPFLFIVLAVLQWVGVVDKLYPQIEILLIDYLKQATGATVGQYIKNSISQIKPSALGITGAILLVLTSLGLIRDIDSAFHRIWRIKNTSPIYKRIWLYWIILAMVPVALALWTGLRSVQYFDSIHKSVEQQFLFSSGTCVFLFALYKIIPNTKVHFFSAGFPALLAAVSLAIVQKSFLWISLKVFKQNKIYGSLASVPIFLVWVLVVWCVVLTGVALSSFIQKRIVNQLKPA